MILKLVLLFIVIFVTESIAERCPKILTTAAATTTTDELLNAFYIADPDPQTGNVFFLSHPQNRNEQKMAGFIKGSSLTFNVWLQKLHDGREDFKNLWVYITRLVASDIGELFGHKQSLSSQAAAKPRPAINFAELGNRFSLVCASPDKYKTTWPFSCIESKFFCSLSTALAQPLFSGMPAVNNMQCQQANLFQVNKMSKLAVDNDLRATALQKLFHADIVTEFNEIDLLKPLYQSGLVWGSMSVLLSDQNQIRSKIYNDLLTLRQRLDAGCSTYRTVPLGSAYYCKAFAILTRTVECYALPDSSICAYDSMFQQYFQIGKFHLRSELVLVDDMRSRLRESLTALATAIVDKDATALETQLTLHKSCLLVGRDICRNDWAKGFNCGDNEACKLETIVRFDCLIKIVMLPVTNFLTAKGSKRWTDSNILHERAHLNIFLFYAPMRQHSNLHEAEIDISISNLHEEVDELTTGVDASGFVTLLAKLPPAVIVPSWVRRSLCSPDNIRQGYNDFCLIHTLVNAIVLFIEPLIAAKARNTVVLNPSVGYIRILEQFQLQQVAAFLESQSESYFQLLSNQISEIPKLLQKNFQAVGKYFESLAQYDTKKATTDVAGINDLLSTFGRSLNRRQVVVSKRFGELLGLAFRASGAELLQKAVELALEIAINCNPLKHVFGGSNPQSIMDRTSALAQGAVGTSKLAGVARKIIPELAKRAQYLKSGFEKNDKFLGIVKILVHNFNSDDPDFEAKVEQFLAMYNDYSPTIIRSDITGFGALWEATVDEVCEVAFEGGTAVAAAFEITIASKGDCLTLKPLIAELITLDEDIFDNQNELIETLATAVRAKYASTLAAGMSVAYTAERHFDVNFLRHNIILAKFASTTHIWGIVNDYCAILTYTSGGKIPQACVAAIALPNKNALTALIGYEQVKTCHSGNRHQAYLEIPTTTSSSLNAEDKSYINIDKLFTGKTVIFQIPNPTWLVTRGVLSRSETNNAVFVEQFQMFLPVHFNEELLVQINVQPHDVNILRSDDTHYLVQLSAFQLKYKVNKQSCFGTLTWLPYDFCRSLFQVCVTTDARIERDIQPSIYNAWRIRITDPHNLTPLNPKTDFKIKVGLTYCTKTTSAGKKREVIDASPADYSLLKNRTTRQATLRFCCKNNTYWSGSSCQNCPTGSTRRLSGYYCE